MNDPSSLPTAALAPDARTEKLNTKAAGIIGLAVMCSRLLGLAREQIFAALFGGGAAMDAFTAAFRIPNLLRDLFAEGALSTSFVTTFSKTIARGGDDAAWRLANKVATLTAVVLGVLCVAGMVFSAQLVAMLAPGFGPEKAALTAQLTRIMFPFILLVSLAALIMGMLNSKSVFGMPAMASSFFNLGSIVGGVTFGFWIDPHFGPRALVGLALATVFGGALQLAVQLPSLARLGYRFRPDFRWRDAGVKAILLLMGPSVIAASTTQFNVLVNSMFASTLGDGPIFWLSIAFRLMQLPLGLFGVALGTVTLPLLSRLGGGRSHDRVSRRACAGDALRASAHHSVDGRAHHARRTDHFRALSAWEIQCFSSRSSRRCAAVLRHRACRICRAQGVGERVLCARQAQDPDARELRWRWRSICFSIGYSPSGWDGDIADWLSPPVASRLSIFCCCTC